MLFCAPPAFVRAAEFTVDCAATAGKFRPLHGVNNGPLNLGETVDLSKYYRELQVPLARLHDCEWPNPDVVDMHAVFPDPTADPRSPDSYRFSRTDTYIQAIIDAGCGVVYRLGESIELTEQKYHVHPPADYDRWAEACLGVIRHYNHGWADGFHHDIRYWEIWNEPENRPNMWTGDDDDYFRLYAVAARKIKAAYPELKVGGPSVGAVGHIVKGEFRPSSFARAFLAYCRDHRLPLDFFSWHTYTNDPSVYAQKAEGVRRLLDEYGFADVEQHLNEWNYLPDNDWSPLAVAGQGLPRQRFYERQGGAEGAAFVACVLLSLQDSPVDVANFYSGDTNQFGLFTRHGVPKKTLHAFRAFRKLLDAPLRLKTAGAAPGHTALAAGTNESRDRVRILLANFDSPDPNATLEIRNLPWRGPTRCEIFRLDARRDLESTGAATRAANPLKLHYKLPAPGVLLIELQKSE
jgi:hypothetical protein